jgi:uncharacterized membrane protein HdeD (DUF308 family)
MARLGCALSVVWAILLAVLVGVFAVTTNCSSDNCNGWWIISIFYGAWTLMAGVIFVPLGLMSGLALSRRRRRDLPRSANVT